MNETEKQLLENICKTMAKIMLDNFIEFNVFTHELQIQLVKYSHQHYPSNARIAIKTAIDRRMVANIINDKRHRLPDNVLTRIIKEIQYQAANGSDILKKYGKFNSITTMINFAANGANSSAPVVDELIQRGYLKDLGDKVQYQDPKPNHNKLKQFALKFDQLVDGLIKK